MSIIFGAQYACAHYPYVAPLNYQTFNDHSAIILGFYDNPFVSEIAIKNFKFHYHNPVGEKFNIDDTAWAQTQTLSSYSLENKLNGTYRIRGEKEGITTRYTLDAQQWKILMSGQPKLDQTVNEKIIYASQLKKNAPVKSVKTLEIIETFVSRYQVSNIVIAHIYDDFDVQFLTYPNEIKVNQPIQFKLLDAKQGIANFEVEILEQTTDFRRDGQLYKTIKSNEKGELNFTLIEKGQYLLKVDYQQPFSNKKDHLKRYKYTLSFNVI